MKTIFWLRKRATSHVIHLRITINKVQRNHSTGIVVKRNQWIGTDGAWVNPEDDATLLINQRLVNIRKEFVEAYLLIQKEGKIATADGVIKKYLDSMVHDIIIEQNRSATIQDVLSKVFQRKKIEMDAREIEASTYNRYLRFGKDFIKYLKKSNISPASRIERIDLNVASGFISHILNQGKTSSYANKHRDLLNLIVDHCEREGINLRFKSKDILRLHQDDPEIVFLTPEEYEKVKSFHAIGRLSEIKDILIFLCETGVHIADYRLIKKKGEIFKDKNDGYWIRHSRQKTKVEFHILMTELSMEIIDKYGGLNKLPIMADQKINDHLKIIGLTLGIEKNFTTKIGRKTFSNYHLNKKGCDHLVVAAALGLTSPACLKHYVKPDLELIKSQLRKTS